MPEDYNEVEDTATDVKAPLITSLFKRIVGNPIAIAEGATGAPRISTPAIDFQVTAGTNVRSGPYIAQANDDTPLQRAWGIMQRGTLRVICTCSGNGGHVVNQYRNGVLFFSDTQTGTSVNYDLDVLPYDYITYEGKAPGGLAEYSVAIGTGGENFFITNSSATVGVVDNTYG